MIYAKIALGAALVVAALFTIATIRRDGAQDALRTVDRQNQEAGHAADNARSRFDAGCADGLRFDFATGQCAWTTAGGRD